MKTEVTSHARVLQAINLTLPDRTPLDFSANKATLERLFRDLKCDHYRDLLVRLHADIVDLRGVVDPVYRGPVPYSREIGGGVRENFWKMRTKTEQTATGPEEMYCDFVLHQAQTLVELEQHPWPSVDWFDFSDFDKRLEPWAEFAVMASGASVWQHPTFLRGMDQLLMDIALDTEIGNFLLDTFTQFYVDYFDAMITAAKGRIHILRIADDIGMQDRLLISPALFRTHILPRLGKLVDMAHSHQVKVMFHSCGSIIELIDDLIDIGVDILDPLQVTAKGMEPSVLKERFGQRICLHGSMDTQYLLPQGTPKQVARTTEQMLEVLGKDGGFILSPSHVLQTDVPTENILALYDTAYQNSGDY